MYKLYRRLVDNSFLSIGFLILLPCLFIPAYAVAAKGALDDFLEKGEKFDHLTTGFALTGEHTQIDCGDCHIGGVFDALTRQCEGCHDNVISIGKSLNHVETQKPCDSCHTTSDFIASAEMDHSISSSTCTMCHNGIASNGKSTNHMASTEVCRVCHSTSYWAPAMFVDHGQVLGSCFSCHNPNGPANSSKPIDHINSSNTCEGCHFAAGEYWSPAATVDHQLVLGACSSCHDGVTARGKGPDHIVTNEECNACHIVNDPNWTATTGG